MWFLGWWPHALLHGLNPFVTHAMFYPDGYNMTWAASLPLPAFALSPITLVFGPAVSWNVLELLSPALSFWTAFLLCRHLTRRLWPSLIGGYVFGFSPFVLSSLRGAPNVGFVAILPLLVVVVLLRLDDRISPPRFVASMTLLLAAQYLIGTELLATSTLFGAVALMLGYALMSDRRAALISVAKYLPVIRCGRPARLHRQGEHRAGSVITVFPRMRHHGRSPLQRTDRPPSKLRETQPGLSQDRRTEATRPQRHSTEDPAPRIRATTSDIRDSDMMDIRKATRFVQLGGSSRGGPDWSISPRQSVSIVLVARLRRHGRR